MVGLTRRMKKAQLTEEKKTALYRRKSLETYSELRNKHVHRNLAQAGQGKPRRKYRIWKSATRILHNAEAQAREQDRMYYRQRQAARLLRGEKTPRSTSRYFATFTENDAPVLLAVRQMKKHGIPPDARRVMEKQLGLNAPYIGRLLPNDEETRALLFSVSDFVRVAHPSEADLRNLLHTRCEFMEPSGGSTQPVNGNGIIEALFSPFGIICLDDLIEELIKRGKHADLILKMLAPLKLNAAEGKTNKRKIKRKLLEMPHVQDLIGGTDAPVAFAGAFVENMRGQPRRGVKVVRKA